jgi:hypothetical protein
LSFLCPDVQLRGDRDKASQFVPYTSLLLILDKQGSFCLGKRGSVERRDEGKSARRVVPKMYREQIVKLCHDPPLAGHQGIERTIPNEI